MCAQPERLWSLSACAAHSGERASVPCVWLCLHLWNYIFQLHHPTVFLLPLVCSFFLEPHLLFITFICICVCLCVSVHICACVHVCTHATACMGGQRTAWQIGSFLLPCDSQGLSSGGQAWSPVRVVRSRHSSAHLLLRCLGSPRKSLSVPGGAGALPPGVPSFTNENIWGWTQKKAQGWIFKTHIIYFNHIISSLPTPRSSLPPLSLNFVFSLVLSQEKTKTKNPKKPTGQKIIKQNKHPHSPEPWYTKWSLSCANQCLLGLPRSVVDMHNDTPL